MRPIHPASNAVVIALLLITLSAACSSDPEGPGAPPDLGPPPEISEMEILENPQNHLSLTVRLVTDVPSRARLRVEGSEGRSWVVDSPSEPTTTHEFHVLGMYADAAYTLTATARSERGAWSRPRTLGHETAPLPPDFPPMEVRVSRPERMQPGVTLFNVYRYNPFRDFFWGLLLAVDETGRVVWYHRSPLMIIVVAPLQNGNILYNLLTYGWVEIDRMGNSVGGYLMLQLGLDTLHHDVCELPSGNMLSLSTEVRTIDGYPLEGGGVVAYNVVGDVALEMTRNGDLVETWSLFDYLDPHRVLPGFHDSSFWSIPYFYKRAPKDWTHANSVLHDPRDDSILISVRHQDWVIKIDRRTGEMLWRFGDEGDFVMVGDGRWPYHQHSPELLPGGNLLLYDNGNHRPTLAVGEAPFSRAVEYELDEANRTVRQVWEYAGEAPYYSPFLGDANGLPNGNVLITDGAIVDDPFMHELAPANHKWLRIVEVTRDDPPEKVFELVIDDRSDDRPVSYTAYRALRLPSLYPSE